MRQFSASQTTSPILPQISVKLYNNPVFKVQAQQQPNNISLSQLKLPSHPSISSFQEQPDNGSSVLSNKYPSNHSKPPFALQTHVSHHPVSQHKFMGYPSAPPLPEQFSSLTPDDVEDVKTFVFFVGYGRSGHSIVASMMDAHPNVIIAHEYYLFNKLAYKRRSPRLRKKINLFNDLYFSSYVSAMNGWRAAMHTSKGYNLNLNGTWQGQFRKLRVIGDKTAGATTMLYYTSAALFKAVLRRLQEVAGVPLRVVHVVRNPYDMIATVALYQASSDPDYKKVSASLDNPFKRFKFLAFAMKNVLKKAEAVDGMGRHFKLHILEVHLEDLIKDTHRVLLQICKFVGVPCTEEYMRSCLGKVYRHASRSRNLVVWPSGLRKQVEQAIKEIPFFNRYSFAGE